MDVLSPFELEVARLLVETLHLEDISPEEIIPEEPLFGEGARPGFHRCPGTGAGDFENLWLSIAFRRQGKPARVRLAACPERAYHAMPCPLGIDRRKGMLFPRPWPEPMGKKIIRLLLI